MRMTVGAVVVPAHDNAASMAPRGTAMLVVGLDGGTRLAMVTAADRRLQRPARFADQLRLCERQNSTTVMASDDVTVVGYWDATLGELRLHDHRTLSGWVGRPLHRDDLQAQDSQQAIRDDARQRARRLDMQGRPHEAMRVRAQHHIRSW